MAQEININIKQKLDDSIKQLKAYGKDKTFNNLSERDQGRFKGAVSKAESALAAQDFTAFGNQFRKAVEVLKVFAESKLGIETKKLTELVRKAEKDVAKLNEAINNPSITAGGKLKQDVWKANFTQAQRNAKAEGKEFGRAIGGKALTQQQGYDIYQNQISKYIAEGNKVSNITNELAQSWGLQDRTSAQFLARFGREQESAAKQAAAQREEAKELLPSAQEKLALLQEKLGQTAEEGSEGVTKLVTSLNSLVTSTTSDIKEGKREQTISANIEAPNLNLEEATKQTQKLDSNFGKAIKTVTGYALALRFVKRALKDAVKTVVDLDKYLTEQAMVTGKTRKETYGLLKSYQDIAKQCGATTKEVAEVSTQFMRQGKTAEEALTLTQAAVSAAKVAGISATESVNYLTTALNGFQLSAEDAMKVSDKFAAVAAVSATSYDELATALSKVASQANLAGMSIDYTTALLAKGIETTREAPETIGTALKTVIARMREMTDYGETLGGDTDVNNVESQLAYVGIALKDANGELRSTEDVLNDLGAKWDTLNSNQQAAIAKALAGTRQQSRLIAMMTDYERVTELQQIAQESSGATMAQMETYMEGMAAAINNVKVAWEEIISSITNSDILSGLLNFIGGALSSVGQILDTTAGMVGFIFTIAAVGGRILGNKIMERQIAKENNKLALEENKTALKKLKIKAQEFLLNRQQYIDDLKTKKVHDGLTAEEEKLLEYYQDPASVKQAQAIVDTYDAQNLLLNEQDSLLNKLTGSAGTLTPLITGISLAWLRVKKAINEVRGAQGKAAVESKAQTEVELADSNRKKKAKITEGGAKIIGQIGIYGIAIAAALMAAFGVFGGFASLGKSTSERVDEASASIYNMSKQVSAIKTIASQYDDLDNKLIKTNEDLKKTNELLDSAADKLDSEKEIEALGGVSAQEYYNSAVDKRKALDTIEKVLNQEILEQYEIQKRLLSKTSNWITGTDAESLSMQEAVRKSNNAQLYLYIDRLKEVNDLTTEEAQNVQNVTQALLENVAVAEAWGMANNPSKIQDLANSLASIKSAVVVNGSKQILSIADILSSDDYTVTEQVNALRAAKEALGGASKNYQYLVSYYSGLDVFSQMSDSVLELIDRLSISADTLNNMYSGWEALQKVGLNITQQQYEGIFSNLLEAMNESSDDVGAIVDKIFGQYLGALDRSTEEYANAWNQCIHIIEQAMGQSILNIGQEVDTISNTVNSIYEKASKWNELTETERTDFLTTNADIFAGEGALYNAFLTGDYQAINKALLENETLMKKYNAEVERIQNQLAVEKARVGEEYSQATVDYLEALLKDVTKTQEFFQASLELQVKQEKEQLDIYQEALDKQQAALEDSLNKRKEAYEKYFEAINQEAEDEEYEEQTSTLIENLSKLSASTNAADVNNKRQLEAQLEDLEKQHLDDLRQRAQEAIVKNIEDEVSQMNDKLEEIKNSSQLMLQSMLASMSNPVQFAASTLLSGAQGMTALQARDYLSSFTSAFGSILPTNFADQLQISESNGTVVFQIGDQTYDLTDSKAAQELKQLFIQMIAEEGYNV